MLSLQSQVLEMRLFIVYPSVDRLVTAYIPQNFLSRFYLSLTSTLAIPRSLGCFS